MNFLRVLGSCFIEELLTSFFVILRRDAASPSFAVPVVCVVQAYSRALPHNLEIRVARSTFSGATRFSMLVPRSGEEVENDGKEMRRARRTDCVLQQGFTLVGDPNVVDL